MEFKHILTIAKNAGNELRRSEGSTFVVHRSTEEEDLRSGHTTSADKNSLNYIINSLRKQYPEDGIIAEGLKELSKDLNIELDEEWKHKSKTGKYWVVDPLCGTLMHERGIPDYIVSIALATEDTDILFGCVYDPSEKNIFYAKKGEGAYINERKIKGPSSINSLEDAIVSIEHKIIREQSIRDLSKKIKRQRTAGTCGLELSYVAEGKLDGLLKAKQPLYDHAAGYLIIKEVGAIITDFQGNPPTIQLGYKKCTNLVASNGKIHEALLEYTKRFN